MLCQRSEVGPCRWKHWTQCGHARMRFCNRRSSTCFCDIGWEASKKRWILLHLYLGHLQKPRLEEFLSSTKNVLFSAASDLCVQSLSFFCLRDALWLSTFHQGFFPKPLSSSFRGKWDVREPWQTWHWFLLPSPKWPLPNPFRLAYAEAKKNPEQQRPCTPQGLTTRTKTAMRNRRLQQCWLKTCSHGKCVVS